MTININTEVNLGGGRLDGNGKVTGKKLVP